MDRPPRDPPRSGSDRRLRLRLSGSDPAGFDLQGHRGARGLHPENTLEGFAAAADLGSFEVDVAVTRDGVPVLHHDPALHPDIAREPGGRWITEPILLRHLSWAELGRYDVGRLRPGSAYVARWPRQAPHEGARIPTLAAALAAQPGARFNVELKLLPEHPDWTVPPEEMAERVLAVVDAAGAGDRVTVQSFDWRAPRHVARTRPDIARGWLTERRTLERAELWLGRAVARVPDAIADEGGGTWTPYFSDLTQADLARAHALGLRVIPWTVNERADAARLVKWGVDGLITDYPDVL